MLDPAVLGTPAHMRDLKRLVFTPPTGSVYPRHRSTGAAGPYRSRSGWPEFEVQYDSERATVGQQISNVDQLVEDDLPVYPSGQDAVAHFVFGTPPDERDLSRIGMIVVRLPDRRARIATLQLRRGRLTAAVEGNVAETRIRLAWRETNASSEWSWHEWQAPDETVHFPMRGIPYQVALYLVARSGEVLDNRGWNGSYGDLPHTDDWEPGRIIERIRAGEDEFTEFKQVVDKSKTYEGVTRTVSAFANGGGGVIFIGVTDAGEIVGADARVRPSLDEAIRHRVKPQPPYRWLAVRLRGTPIQALVVASGSPTIFKSDRIVWIRVQATTREAESHEISRLGSPASSGGLHLERRSGY